MGDLLKEFQKGAKKQVKETTENENDRGKCVLFMIEYV